VGVVSRGGPDCSTPVYGTVTAWRDFLTKTARDAAQLGAYEAPFWVTTGSSDPPELPNDGSAGAAGAPAQTTAVEGESCSADLACGEGLLCYAASGDTEQASCVAECESSAECSAGQECQDVGSSSICGEPHGKGVDDSGCAVAMGSSSSRWLGVLTTLGLLSVLARRRARSVQASS
jgi:hypothetical protein